MSKIKRITSVCLVIVVLLCSVFAVSINAEENTTLVYFRIVWHKKNVEYATVVVTIQKYEDPECTIEIGAEESFGIDKYGAPLENWERAIYLSEGYWRVTFMTPVNEWQVRCIGESDVFYVRSDVECMTVYVGLAPDGETFTLPDPSVVYKHDDRDFWIWTKNAVSTKDPVDDTSGDNITETEYDPFNIFDTGTTTKGGEDNPLVPEVTIKGTESSLPTYNDNSGTTTAENNNERTERLSATVGTWIVTIVLGLIIIGGFIFLIISKHRKNTQ